jgi:hypothetical protein
MEGVSQIPKHLMHTIPKRDPGTKVLFRSFPNEELLTPLAKTYPSQQKPLPQKARTIADFILLHSLLPPQSVHTF